MFGDVRAEHLHLGGMGGHPLINQVGCKPITSREHKAEYVGIFRRTPGSNDKKDCKI